MYRSQVIASKKGEVENVQVFRDQSLVEQLLIDLEFSWTGTQRFQLMVSLIIVPAMLRILCLSYFSLLCIL